MVLIVIKVTLLLEMTVSGCFRFDFDVLNFFKAKSIGAGLTTIFYCRTDSLLKYSIIAILV